MISDAGRLTRKMADRNAWYAYVGAAVALTGVVMVAPSLPVMREALNLSEAQLSLIMSVYLLPAALGAVPAGILADRIGRRRVFGWALIGFGGAGALLPFAGDSFSLFLAIRFFQGVMFAGLLPLTMTILGDAFRGIDLVRAQGRRSVAMGLAGFLLPAFGGVAVAGGWFVPWFGQASGVVLGILVLVGLVDSPEVHTSRAGRLDIGSLIRIFRSRSIAVLEYAGFLRLFSKFAVITFLPVFLVGERGRSPAFAGLVIGLAAIAGTIVALSSGRLASRRKATTWIGVGVVATGLAVAGMVTLPWSPAIIGAALLYGAAEGLSGVFVNSLVTVATDTEQRATFVAATGAIRNFGKFLAPASFGAATLFMPLAGVFLILAMIAAVSGALAPMLAPIEARLAGSGVVRPLQ